MYQKLPQLPRELIKLYFIQVLIVAILAYTFYFWFGEACNMPRGTSGLAQGYFYGLFFNFPLWLILYLICGIFSRALLKIYKPLFIGTLITIIIFFVKPLLFNPGTQYWYTVVHYFCVAVFLFCYTFFIFFREKYNFKKELNVTQV